MGACYHSVPKMKKAPEGAQILAVGRAAARRN